MPPPLKLKATAGRVKRHDVLLGRSRGHFFGVFLALSTWVFTCSAPAQAQIAPDFFQAAFKAQNLVESGGDLSRENVVEVRAALDTGLKRLLASDPGYFQRRRDVDLPKLYLTLGQLSLMAGQPAEAERMFAAAATADKADPANAIGYQRARAIALVLDGRYDAALDMLAPLPRCQGGEVCGQLNNYCGADGLALSRNALFMGPSGLCAAKALERIAQEAEVQSRPELVEPYYRAAIFAGGQGRFYDQTAVGEAKWATMRSLINWLSERGRGADAGALLAEQQQDKAFVAAAARELRWAQQETAQRAPRRGTSEANASADREADARIATNKATLARLLTRQTIPGARERDRGKLVVAIYVSLVVQYRELRRFREASGAIDEALRFVADYISPNLPLRVDLGPMPAHCPPGRQSEPECSAWYEDHVAAYNSADVAELIALRALIDFDLGRDAAALNADKLAQMAMGRWLERNWTDSADLGEVLQARRSLDEARLDMLQTLSTRAVWQEQARAQAFEVLQLLQVNRVSAAVNQAAARRLAARGEQVELIQERQRLLAERRASINDGTRSQALASRIAEVEARLGMSVSELERQARFRPLSLLEARAALKPNEALVLMVERDEIMETFVVTSSGADWISTKVAARWVGIRVDSLARHLGSETGATEGFDRLAAYDLYRTILGPVAAILEGKSLFVVRTGALAEIPLSVLVTERPTGVDTDPAALRTTSWFFRKAAVVSLPGVSSLPSAVNAAITRRKVSFIGIGDPPGSAAPGEEIREGGSRAALAFAGDELAELARRFAGHPPLVGAAATEAMVRSLNLSSVHILAFATHAVGGDGKEPGLILALSPGQLREDNDGFLSAREVATLVVGADVVVLSACNTASGDGQGGEALTGLAQSFLFAGARAVLATHWPVNDRAAMVLMTSSLTGVGQSPSALAGKLAASMEALLNNRASEASADPRIWAPFTLVAG